LSQLLKFYRRLAFLIATALLQEQTSLLSNLTMLSVNDLAELPALPNSTSKIAALPNGLYAIEQGFDDTFAIDDRVQTKVWFRTPVRQSSCCGHGH